MNEEKKATTRKRSVVDEEITFDERRAAKKIGVSYRQLQRYRAANEITFYRVGARVLYDDRCLREFLEARRSAAA